MITVVGCGSQGDFSSFNICSAVYVCGIVAHISNPTFIVAKVVIVAYNVNCISDKFEVGHEVGVLGNRNRISFLSGNNLSVYCPVDEMMVISGCSGQGGFFTMEVCSCTGHSTTLGRVGSGGDGMGNPNLNIVDTCIIVIGGTALILESYVATGRSVFKEHFLLGQRCGSITDEYGVKCGCICRVGHVADDDCAIVGGCAFVTIGEGEHQVRDVGGELRQDGIERNCRARPEEEAFARNRITAI